MRKLSLNERIARLPLSAQEVVNTCAELLSVGKRVNAVAVFKAYIADNRLTLCEVATLENLILEKKRGVLRMAERIYDWEELSRADSGINADI